MTFPLTSFSDLVHLNTDRASAPQRLPHTEAGIYPADDMRQKLVDADLLDCVLSQLETQTLRSAQSDIILICIQPLAQSSKI